LLLAGIFKAIRQNDLNLVYQPMLSIAWGLSLISILAWLVLPSGDSSALTVFISTAIAWIIALILGSQCDWGR
jgi:hypothetical protein